MIHPKPVIQTSLIEYKHFQNNYIFNAEKYREKFALAFKQLSAIYYTRIAENGKVPSMVTLFELYGFDSEKSTKRGNKENYTGQLERHRKK